MKINISTLIFLSALNMMSATASAQVYRQCKGVYTEQDRFSQSVTGMLFGKLNTTGNRVEEKRVISTDSMAALKTRMQELGYISRDDVAPGTVNVTVTDYMADAKFHLDGKKLKMKTRFRKYGTRDAHVLDGVVTPIKSMTDRSTMEFKIEHPNIANAVIKRQLTILDSDRDLIIFRDKFNSKKNEIKQRLFQLNPGNSNLVELALDLFSARYASNDSGGMDIRTTYDRTAYKILLNPGAGSATGSLEDSQVTLDSNIWFHDYQTGETFRKYKLDEAVVEVKLPPDYLVITPEAVQLRPALQAVSEVRQYVDQNHVSDYVKNKGKSTSAKSKRSVAPELSELIDD